MSRFTDHLGLVMLQFANGRPVIRDGRCLWAMAAPLHYERGALGSGDLFVVPAIDPDKLTDADLTGIRCRGVTDLASIPWPARGLLPPDGPWAKAAVLHDDGYVSKGWFGRCTRLQVDQLLVEAMGVLGVPAWKRAVIYRAVRLFGGKGWGT